MVKLEPLTNDISDSNKSKSFKFDFGMSCECLCTHIVLFALSVIFPFLKHSDEDTLSGSEMYCAMIKKTFQDLI